MGRIRISDAWKLVIFMISLLFGVLFFLSLFMTRNAESTARNAEFQTEISSEELFDVVAEQGNTAIVVFKPTGTLYVSSRGMAALLVNEDGTPYMITQLEEDMGRGNLDE